MKAPYLVLLMIPGLWLGSAPVAQAMRDCHGDPGTPMKNHVCEVLETEDVMVDSATDMIDAACAGNSAKSCETARRRVGNLKLEIQKAHEENDALGEMDYTEMIEASYKGRGKEREPGEKSCQAKDVDPDARDEYLADLEIERANSNCSDCLKYFSRQDEDKAEDNRCNSWKARVIDSNGDRAGIIHVSERQEDLCPTECKGKNNLVEDKKVRFQSTLNTSIEEMGLATAEMEMESLRIASLNAVPEVQAISPDDCDEFDTEAPIPNGVIIAAFTVVHVTEAAVEFCEPPAQQTAFGFNGASACLVLKIAWIPALEIYDILSNLNDEFQGEQITHIQECMELMNTKLDDMGAQIDEINRVVKEVRRLVITPQGQRQSGDMSWPNKPKKTSKTTTKTTTKGAVR